MSNYTDEIRESYLYSIPRSYSLAEAEGVRIWYVNRVWDTVAGTFVRWRTSDAPDSTGSSYPGPGSFVSQTEDYCIERTYTA